MGKQRNLYYVGREENIVYYQWKGGYYIRTKSTLSGERFWKDPAFASSRKRALEFGEAAKLAGEVYRLLPKEMRKRGVIGKLTSLAHQEKMRGKSRDEVVAVLQAVRGLQPKVTVSTNRRGCTAGPTWKKTEKLLNELLEKKRRRLTAAERVMHNAGIFVYLEQPMRAPDDE